MDFLPMDEIAPVYEKMVIGGSSGYQIEGFEVEHQGKVETPYGLSSDIFLGKLDGRPFGIVARHNIGHTIDPTHVNALANFYVIKRLEAKEVLSLSAVGILQDGIEPGDLIIPDQHLDKTKFRRLSYFGDGVVAHVPLAHPFCSGLAQDIYDIAKSLEYPVHLGGTYVSIEGPQFSTKAESEYHRSLGWTIVGMNGGDCRLGWEAELCFAILALGTDLDAWAEDDTVDVEQVLKTIRANHEKSQLIVKRWMQDSIRPRCAQGCRSALEKAIQTNLSKADPAAIERHRWLIERYLPR